RCARVETDQSTPRSCAGSGGNRAEPPHRTRARRAHGMTAYPATIARAVDHELVIKKSRFITHVAPVTSPEDADAVIAAVKKRAWDARHNCSAQVTGALGDRARS